MTIFFYKWLTRNLEIRNTPVRVLPNIWTLGQVRDTKFGTNVSSKILLNAAKCQGYSFYRFWVIQGKPTVGVKLLKMLEYFEVTLNIFEFSHVKEIVETWLVYINRFSWIIESCFITETIVLASFFNFLEPLWRKNKF